MKTTIHWRKWPEEKPPSGGSYRILVKMAPGCSAEYLTPEKYYSTIDDTWNHGLNGEVVGFALPGDIHHDAGGTDGGV